MSLQILSNIDFSSIFWYKPLNPSVTNLHNIV